MTLIKNIAEVKAVLRISNLDDDMSLPDMDQAMYKHIIPVIGNDIVTEITGIYDSGGGTDIQKDLITHIQKPLAAFAYLDNIGIIHATITDRGVARISTAEMPAAFRWEFNEVKSTLEDKALTGMEELLEFLDDNKADFSTWANSVAYKQYYEHLIHNGRDFNKIYPLYQPLRTFHSLRPILNLVEDMYIAPAIGNAFLSEIITTDNPDANVQAILSLLKKAEAYLTIKHSIESMPVRISANGFTVAALRGTDKDETETNRQPAPDNLLRLQMDSSERDGMTYLKQAKNYLNQNASATVFPTYFSSSLYKDPAITPQVDRGNDARKIFRF